VPFNLTPMAHASFLKFSSIYRPSFNRPKVRQLAATVATALCLLALLPSGAAAAAPAPATAEQVTTQLQQQLNAARAELQQLHAQQAAARQQLLEAITAERRQIAALDKQVETTAVLLQTSQGHLEAARRQAEQRTGIVDFTNDILSEYRRALATRLDAAEQQALHAQLQQIDHSRAAAADAAAALANAAPLLRLSETIIENRWAGQVLPGQALDVGGRVDDGQFIQLGPLLYFAGTAAGPVQTRLGSALPTVLESKPQFGNAVRQLLTTGQAQLPIDLTAGGALKLGQARETLLEHLRKGGITMLPLLLMAALCTVLAIAKFITMLPLRAITAGNAACEQQVRAVVAALANREVELAQQQAMQLPMPLGPVIAEGVRYQDQPLESIEEIMSERLLAQVPSLERYLTPLAVCASAAPLLGLLGTVTGMIHTFGLISVFGTGDARLLSSGISEALVTTEVGLIIAIPALLTHAYLARRVRDVIAGTQQAAILFVNAMKLTTTPTAPTAAAKTRSKV